MVAVLAALAAAALLAPHSGGAATLVATPSPVAAAPPATAPAPADTPTATVRVLGLGDSVTAGTNCDCADYVTGFGRLLAQRDGSRVTVDNRGESGATAADLAGELDQDPTLRAATAQADIIVITVGANDLSDSLDQWRSAGCPRSCYEPDVTAMSHQLGTVLATVRRLHSASPVRILVTTYWNVFADGQVAEQGESAGYLRWSDQVTRAADRAISEAATRAGVGCVDLYPPFKPHPGDDPTDLLADDGDHPNPAGTALISRTVLAALGPERAQPR